MSTTLDQLISKYLQSGNPVQQTREEYQTTLRKWQRWGNGDVVELLDRMEWVRVVVSAMVEE